MNDSNDTYKLWLCYIEKLSVETLLNSHIRSLDFAYIHAPNDVARLTSGHRRFSIWNKGVVYTFRGPDWTRMLPNQEDKQISLHINPTVLDEFERLVFL